MGTGPKPVPPPDIPPPPPAPGMARRMVHPVFLSAWLGGCAWIYFREPDEEDYFSSVPKFLEDVKPVRRANE